VIVAATEFAFRSFRMQKYSKWGQLVFEAFNNIKKQDGNFKEKTCSIVLTYGRLIISTVKEGGNTCREKSCLFDNTIC